MVDKDKPGAGTPSSARSKRRAVTIDATPVKVEVVDTTAPATDVAASAVEAASAAAEPVAESVAATTEGPTAATEASVEASQRVVEAPLAAASLTQTIRTEAVVVSAETAPPAAVPQPEIPTATGHDAPPAESASGVTGNADAAPATASLIETPTETPTAPVASVEAAPVADASAVVEPTPAVSATAPVEAAPVAREPVAEPAAAPSMAAAAAGVGAAASIAATAIPANTASPKQPSILGPALAAGLVGGVLALGGAYGLTLAGLWPQARPTVAAPDLAPLQARLTQVQTRVDELAAAPRLAARDAALITDLPNRLAALEKAAADAARGGSALPADLTQRIDALKKLVDERQPRLDQITADLAKVREEMARVAAQAGRAVATSAQPAASAATAAVQQAEGAAQQAIADLQARLAALEAKPVAPDLSQTTKALQSATDEVRARLAQLETEAKAIAAQASDAATRKASEAAGAVSSAVNAQVSELRKLIDGMSGQVGSLEKTAGAGMAARDQATLAVAIGALKTALDQGRPFSQELATAKALARGSIDLAALDRVAEVGVVPGPVLVEQFKVAARKVLDHNDQTTAASGFVDRLWLNAQQIVRVRPTGEAVGEGIPETIARIEARLLAGDLAGALTQWRMLPEAARGAAGGFGPALEARVAADAALDAVSRSILSTLTKPAG
jgi:hypothetical protein